MVAGYLPFHSGNNKQELCNKILRGAYTLPNFISVELSDLIRRMLTVDPNHRITIAQVWWESKYFFHKELLWESLHACCLSLCVTSRLDNMCGWRWMGEYQPPHHRFFKHIQHKESWSQIPPFCRSLYPMDTIRLPQQKIFNAKNTTTSPRHTIS